METLPSRIKLLVESGVKELLIEIEDAVISLSLPDKNQFLIALLNSLLEGRYPDLNEISVDCERLNRCLVGELHIF